MSTALSILIDSTKDVFLSKLSDKHMNFEAEAGFAIQALSSDYATKLALANKQSVFDAITNVAAIGLSLNPAKKQAYLVPRQGKICLDVSYMGLIDLAVSTGSILWAQCVVVYENDDFALQGNDLQPIHKFNPFSTARGNKIGAYACVKTPSGDYLTHAMSLVEVFAIRDRSESWKAGKSGPWKSDENEMIKKTVIKQAYKYWPKTSEAFTQALHYLNVEAGEGLAEINVTPLRRGAPQPVAIEVDYAEQSRLVALLELSAANGLQAFQASWMFLESAERRLVGTAEKDRIKLIAESSKTTIIEHDDMQEEVKNG